ncbi:hypothetical protein SRHO_G00259650 [Serrasalmus rhombeus]
MLGIRKSHTTPYHPQGDPQPERFNRTLLSMLGTLDPRQKQRSRRRREHFLPDLRRSTEVNLQEVYKLAANAAEKNHERNKKIYDRLVKEQVLEKGDRVLLRNLGVTGKHKLQNKWRIMPYVVVGKMDNQPVYTVKPESGCGEVKTVHQNHLLPIGCLVRMPVDDDAPSPPQRPMTREQQRQRESQTVSGCELQDGEARVGSDESEDSDIETFHPVSFDSGQILNDLLQYPDLQARIQDSSATGGHNIPSANCTERAAGTRDDTDHPPIIWLLVLKVWSVRIYMIFLY